MTRTQTSGCEESILTNFECTRFNVYRDDFPAVICFDQLSDLSFV